MSWKHITTLAVLGSMAACSTMPERIPELESARAEVETAQRRAAGASTATVEVEEAAEALKQADTLYKEGGDLEDIRYHAYRASRHAEIALERVEEARIREDIDESEIQRNRLLLQAREREAERRAAEAELRAREADRMRDIARRESARADRAAAAARTLAEELEDLRAEQTDRGLVLTLGDVLFDTGEAELKPGADKVISQLAGFLSDRPDRRLLIEGHTDSRGSEEYNRELSRQRAEAVKNALTEQGVDSARLEARGLGEAYPVATNDTMAGRQENRRVEVVVSAKDGSFEERRRTAASRQ